MRAREKEGRSDDFGYVAHAIIGFIFSAPFHHIPGDVLIGMFAALMPDIDIKTSLLGRFNPFVRWMKHRGFTHTIFCAVAVSIPFIFVNVQDVVFIGYMSHLISDWFSSMGKWKIKII